MLLLISNNLLIPFGPRFLASIYSLQSTYKAFEEREMLLEKMVEQKGMTFDHDFGYSLPFYLPS